MPSLESGGICGERSWGGGGKSVFTVEGLVLVVVSVEDMEEVSVEDMEEVSVEDMEVVSMEDMEEVLTEDMMVVSTTFSFHDLDVGGGGSFLCQI
jgi:hypothetical protein